ncbi:cAMP-specific 3',5'-cyclic phosphodiesterase, like, partial [Thalictrum thalictroides]
MKITDIYGFYAMSNKKNQPKPNFSSMENEMPSHCHAFALTLVGESSVVVHFVPDRIVAALLPVLMRSSEAQNRIVVGCSIASKCIENLLVFRREQQPLRLNPAEVQEVIAAVCSETSLPKSHLITVSSRLNNSSGKPSMDAAVSVLIKLVIDMYVLDSRTAAPFTLSMLEEMLRSLRLASKVRAFDLIINLGIHAHLLEPMLSDDPPTIEEELPQEIYLNNEGQLLPQVNRNSDSCKQQGIASAVYKFESWLLNILHEILLLLVQ